MIGAGISSEVECEGHSGLTVGRGTAGAVPVDRAHVALRAQGLAHMGAQVQQRMIERGIGTSAPGEVVQVQPKLPSMEVLVTPNSADYASRGVVQKYGTATEAEAEHGIDDVVADPGERRQGGFRRGDTAIMVLDDRVGDTEDVVSARSKTQRTDGCDHGLTSIHGSARLRRGVDECAVNFRHFTGAHPGERQLGHEDVPGICPSSSPFVGPSVVGVPVKQPVPERVDRPACAPRPADE